MRFRVLINPNPAEGIASVSLTGASDPLDLVLEICPEIIRAGMTIAWDRQLGFHQRFLWDLRGLSGSHQEMRELVRTIPGRMLQHGLPYRSKIAIISTVATSQDLPGIQAQRAQGYFVKLFPLPRLAKAWLLSEE